MAFLMKSFYSNKAKPVPCIEIFIKQVLAFMVPKSEIRIVRIFGSGQAFKRCNCFRPREVKKSPNEPAGEKCGRIPGDVAGQARLRLMSSSS